MTARWPKPTCIHQLLPSFSPKDAIGNEAVLIQQALRDQGFQSEIFADMGQTERPPASFRVFGRNTFLLYHFSISSHLLAHLAAWDGCKLIRYHSVTPPEFFGGKGEMHAREACRLGLRQMPMAGVIATGIAADSHFNALEIGPFSRTSPIVIPVFRDYESLLQINCEPPAGRPIHSPKHQLLFVGRIAPNKCQHHLLQLLALAKKFISPDLQLNLVGSFFSDDYRLKLERLAEGLGLHLGGASDASSDIRIFKHVSDEEMAALYREARVFVSMSEHEGFGVPLVEAMHFDLPILAARETAVPLTVGDGGILIDKTNWPETLGALRALLFDEQLRATIKLKMAERRKQLALPVSQELFRSFIASHIAPHAQV